MDDKNIFNENELDKFINNFNKREIDVPNELENIIIEKINASKSKTNYSKKIIISFIITILLFFGGVKFSSDFAAYASKIEILKPIINFIRYGDKGIQTAYENGYQNMNEINFENNGFIININNIFADKDRLYMTINLSGDKISEMEDNIYNLFIIPEFHSKNFSYEGSVLREDVEYNNKTHINEVELDFYNSATANKVIDENNLELKFALYLYDYELKKKILINEFDNIKIPLNKIKIKDSKIYPQNKNIKFQYGEINLQELTVSPTRMSLNYETKMLNDYTFEGFEKFYIKDSKGNIYEPEGLLTRNIILNKSIISGNIYFVPSIYFKEENIDLYLCIEGFKYMKLDEKNILLNRKDIYPKTIKYMKQDVIFYKPTKNTEGNIIVSYDISSSNEYNEYLFIKCENANTKSFNKTKEIVNGKEIIHFEYIFDIKEQDKYNLYFDTINNYIDKEHIEVKLKFNN